MDLTSPSEPPAHICLLKAAQLVPGRAGAADNYFLKGSRERRWPDLIVSTRTIRALLLACRESRAATLRHFPDKLPFSVMPLGDDDDDVEDDEDDEDDEVDPPLPPPTERAPTLYWLPFSAERDIIVLGIGPGQDERLFANWAATRSGAAAPPLLANVRNLALHAGDTSRGRYRWGLAGWPCRLVRPWKSPLPACHCGRPDCQFCSEDPLLEFLAVCFPRLRTLSFAVLDRQGEPSGRIRNDLAFQFELVPPCLCPHGGSGSSRQHHPWPMVKLMNRFGEWCVWYPEAQTECPLPKLPSLEAIRQKWLPEWPYYETLRHVEVRVLRCIEVERGRDELVSGWRALEPIRRTEVHGETR